MQDLTKEVFIRKVNGVEFLSLDGVMASPEEWAPPLKRRDGGDERSGDGRFRRVATRKSVVRGLAVFWPHQPSRTPMADYINSVPKLVVSGTLEEPLWWNNSTLIKGGVAEGVAEQKRRPGRTSRSSERRPRTITASRRAHRRARADGAPDSPGKREAPLRGRGRPEASGARGFEDVQHGRRLPHLPARQKGSG